MNRLHIILLIIFCNLLQIGCSGNNYDDSLISLPELIPYRKGDLWGYCDKDKNIKIACQYGYAELFDSFGFAKVYAKFPNLGTTPIVGLIDNKGVMVVPIAEKEDFQYSVIPNNGIESLKFGKYDYVKHNNKLVVLEMNPLDNLYENIFVQSVSDSYGSLECYNGSGEKILSDSFYYSRHYQSLDSDVKYIIGMHKRTRQHSVFSKDGIKLNDLEFDQIFPRDSATFLAIKSKKTNGVFNSGIYTVDGKTIVEGPYAIRGKLRNYIRLEYQFYPSQLAQKESIEKETYLYPLNEYKLHNNFVVVPDLNIKPQQFFIKKHDMTPLVSGNYSSIRIDELFDLIYLTKNDTIKCINFNGEEVAKLTRIDSIYSIDSIRFIVRKNGLNGVWSATKNNYILNNQYKKIYLTCFSTYVLQDVNNKYCIADSVGNFNKKEYFDAINIDSADIALRNDSLFYIDKVGYKTAISSNVRTLNRFGDIILFEKYIVKDGYSPFDKGIGYNYKTKKYLLDTFLGIHRTEEFMFNTNFYLMVDKPKFHNQNTGQITTYMGVLNQNGEYIIPCVYDRIYNGNNYILAKKESKIEVYSINVFGERKALASFVIPDNTVFENGFEENGLMLLIDISQDEENCLGYINFKGTKFYE